MSAYVLVLYYSRTDSVRQLAMQVARGIEETGLEARVRTVPPVSPDTEASASESSIASRRRCLDHLRGCAALAMGSPTRFGNMAAPMKYFLDSTSELWMDGALVDKPAGVFTSSSSLHGGQESTLLTMMVPLLHHGMVLAGLPYTEAALMQTQGGGTPYGPSHVAGTANQVSPTEHEAALARALGRRLATLASRLERSQ